MFRPEGSPEERKRFRWDFRSAEDLLLRFHLDSLSRGGKHDPTGRIPVRYCMFPVESSGYRNATGSPKNPRKLFRWRNKASGGFEVKFCASDEISVPHRNTEGGCLYTCWDMQYSFDTFISVYKFLFLTPQSLGSKFFLLYAEKMFVYILGIKRVEALVKISEGLDLIPR